MAPQRARMTHDLSIGVAVKVKLAGIGTCRRLLGNKLTRPLSYVCSISLERYSGVWHEAGAAAPACVK